MYSRFYLTIYGGMIAGILNITGLLGFLFFIVYSLIIGLVFYIVVSLNHGNKTYFISNTALITQNITSGFMTYLIFWVMFYNFVHIYAY